MEKKQANIFTLIVFAGVVLHYCVGLFFWRDLPVGDVGKICIYFALDVNGFVLFLLANNRTFRGLGALGMILGCYFLYKELVDNSNPIEKDVLTLGLLFSNCYFIWYFSDKIKNKRL